MIYAGPDRSVFCATRTLEFDQLYVIYAGPGRSFYCATRTLKFDQQDVIYAGLGRSFYCVTRTLELTSYKLFMLARAGHFTAPPSDFFFFIYIDRLSVIYTGSDSSFIASSELL